MSRKLKRRINMKKKEQNNKKKSVINKIISEMWRNDQKKESLKMKGDLTKHRTWIYYKDGL